MYKIVALVTMWLALLPAWSPQNDEMQDCYKRCHVMPQNDPEMQRQEIVNLEREAAHAIQQGDGTFFRRVYSDEFTGTLSRGEPVNKTGFIDAVQSAAIRYQSFNVSDIKVRIYRDTAVATCLWSSRSIVKGQFVSSQMRAIHIYISGGSGWRVIAGQESPMPPYMSQVL
ncbi:MAG: nuclear transport factor 2 family protein [Candidatus Acidiferrales bacterium]